MIVLSIFYKNKKGGFSKRLYQLYQHLASEKHNLHFISAGALPFLYNRIYQHIIKTPFVKQENAFFWLYFIVSSVLVSFATARKYQIKTIFTFSPFYTALLFMPICVLKIPAVTFIRADNMKHSTCILRNGFFYLTDWLGIILSSKVLVVSNALKKTYKKRYRIDNQKIVVQPNNIEKKYIISNAEKIDVHRSLGISPDEFLITTSGAFNEGKNFSFLIRAMENLTQQNIKLAIIGDEVTPTGERKRLEKLTTQLGLQDQVIFCGWQENPARFIASSDLYVYPSKYEGSPNALLEALGCLVPCLGSRIEEIAEILHFDELLFPLEDESVLTEKILRASGDSTYHEHLKKLSLECCENFSFDWGSETIKKIMSC